MNTKLHSIILLPTIMTTLRKLWDVTHFRHPGQNSYSWLAQDIDQNDAFWVFLQSVILTLYLPDAINV